MKVDLSSSEIAVLSFALQKCVDVTKEEEMSEQGRAILVCLAETMFNMEVDRI